jgi:hypothetical protein
VGWLSHGFTPWAMICRPLCGLKYQTNFQLRTLTYPLDEKVVRRDVAAGLPRHIFEDLDDRLHPFSSAC